MVALRTRPDAYPAQVSKKHLYSLLMRSFPVWGAPLLFSLLPLRHVNWILSIAFLFSMFITGGCHPPPFCFSIFPSQICIYQKFVVPLHRQRDNLGPPTGANVVHPVGRAETPNAQMTTLSSVNARGCRQRRTFASSKGPQDFVYCVQIISGQSAPPPSFSPITRNVLPLSEGVASAEKGIKNNHQ